MRANYLLLLILVATTTSIAKSTTKTRPKSERPAAIKSKDAKKKDLYVGRDNYLAEKDVFDPQQVQLKAKKYILQCQEQLLLNNQ